VKSNNWIQIKSETQFNEFIRLLEYEKLIPFDLEADSMYCYHPKICLLQFTIAENNYIIDPFDSFDLNRLFNVLKDKTLIIHGCDYDLRMLRSIYQFQPHAVYDTMIAARYLGWEHFGLGALFHRYYGIELDKSNQKANWSKRPLTIELLDYAALDTQFLLDIYKKQQESLIELNRLNWVDQHCAYILEQCQNEAPQVDLEKWRVKGSHILNRKQLGILKALWEWRENIASSKDHPPYKILASEKMIDLSFRLSSMKKITIENLPKMPKNMDNPVLESICERINLVLQLSLNELPEKTKRFQPNTPCPNPLFLEKLKEFREIKANNLNIDPHLIANKTQLVYLALHRPQKWDDVQKINFLPWQWELWKSTLQ
jgi:ribonuclease D